MIHLHQYGFSRFHDGTDAFLKYVTIATFGLFKLGAGKQVCCVGKGRVPLAVDKSRVPTAVVNMQMAAQHEVDVLGVYPQSRHAGQVGIVGLLVPGFVPVVGFVIPHAGIDENQTTGCAHQERLNGHDELTGSPTQGSRGQPVHVWR